MLVPHNPSKNLMRASRKRQTPASELKDVEVTVVDYTGPELPEKAGVPVSNGRTKRFNPTLPPP